MPKNRPLTKLKHANVKVRAQTAFNEFINVAALPLYAFEAARIARTHPLAFIRTDERFTLVLPCSLSEALPSAWVSREGKWIGGHIPMIITQRPFVALPGGNDKAVLCIDEDSALIGDEGNSLFNEDGTNTDFLIAKAKLLEFLYSNGVMTEKIVSTLQELNLIFPWEFQVAEKGSESRDVGGLYRIDEDALNGLSDKNWLDLKNIGAMGLIYAQMLSMGHLEKLLQGVMTRVRVDRTAEEKAYNISELFGEEDEGINFDNI